MHRHFPVGTWTFLYNQFGDDLVVSAQTDTGRGCQTITGNFVSSTGGTNPFTGFYCPSTGRIIFARLRPTTQQLYIVFEGNLADRGKVDKMAGTYADFSGNNSESSWYATK